MKTDKVVKKLGAGAKNNTDCRSFSYSIRSFPTVIPSHGINPTEFFCIVWCIPFRDLVNYLNCDNSTSTYSTLFEEINCSTQKMKLLISTYLVFRAVLFFASRGSNTQITSAQIITAQIPTARHVGYTCTAAKNMCGSKFMNMFCSLG
jgi:hypothetical protein